MDTQGKNIRTKYTLFHKMPATGVSLTSRWSSVSNSCKLLNICKLKAKRKKMHNLIVCHRTGLVVLLCKSCVAPYQSHSIHTQCRICTGKSTAGTCTLITKEIWCLTVLYYHSRPLVVSHIMGLDKCCRTWNYCILLCDCRKHCHTFVIVPACVRMSEEEGEQSKS